MSLIIMQKLANGCFWSQISRSRESVKSMERSHRLEKAIDRWCSDDGHPIRWDDGESEPGRWPHLTPDIWPHLSTSVRWWGLKWTWEVNGCTATKHHLSNSSTAARLPRSIVRDDKSSIVAVFQVNATKERVFLFANISITVVTFAINLWAGLSIHRKERTRLHFLIICDCAANVVFCIHTSFLQSPWNILNSSMLCRINIFVLVLLTAWNRLVPLAIAAFRYIMVCHAVFVQNHGGEKQVGFRSQNTMWMD